MLVDRCNLHKAKRPSTPHAHLQNLTPTRCRGHLSKTALTLRATKLTNTSRSRRGSSKCTEQSHSAGSDAPPSADPIPSSSHQVAVEGDTVTVNYKCMNHKGEIIETSDVTDPLTFEVGAGEVMGNKMFQAFDAGVRGLQIGEKTYLEASGGEWNQELLFSVPRAHEEVQRLEGRYKSVGGLKEGLVVELSNGSNAMVLEVTDDSIRLDANNMMAGQMLMFELELVSIESSGTAQPS